jgi:hypothetical protein
MGTTALKFSFTDAFYSDNPKRPMSGNILRRDLIQAMKVDFHSFRHYYASGSHQAENLNRMREAAAEIFGNIVKFPVNKFEKSN